MFYDLASMRLSQSNSSAEKFVPSGQMPELQWGLRKKNKHVVFGSKKAIPVIGRGGL
jgi:hypothetical protein